MTGYAQGFLPFVHEDSRLLVLGSFPSVKSREEGFYYGNPHNRFWKTVCGFFGEEVPKDVAGKKDFLRRRRIALWDAALSCTIEGSKDASIRDVVMADVAALVAKIPVEAVFCNGKLSHQLLTTRQPPLGVRVECLPSTSPANPRFDAEVWNRALSGIFGERQ